MAEEKNIDVEELQKKLAAAEKKLKAAEKKLSDAESAREEAEKLAINDAGPQEADVKKLLDAQEKVLVHLFKDDRNYSDDVTVGINGYMYKIQRGVDVMVPKSVYKEIQNMQRQNEQAAKLISDMSSSANDSALS